MKKRVKIIAAITGCAAIFAASAGFTNAFLANTTNDLTNVITPGGIGIGLEEPGWKPEDAKNVLPRKIIKKDPYVVNTGKNEEWAFLRVTVPVKEISVVDPDTKRKLPAASTELFGFQASENWTLVSKIVDGSAAHYVYGYNMVMKPGEKTDFLFQEVSMVNYLEGSIDEEETLTLPIEAVSIQYNVDSAGDGLKEIYEDYLAQEIADKAESQETADKA
ncbi:MAG: hypothetical protein PHR92_02190 [Lachnospiraceae bacterium]|nr:hypothetical protein [Lachnospiraceae bacterium]